MDKDSAFFLANNPDAIKKFIKRVSFRELFDFYIETRFYFDKLRFNAIPKKVYNHIDDANMRLDIFLMSTTYKNIDGKPIQLTFRKLFDIHDAVTKYLRRVSFRELFDNYIELRYGEKCIEEIPEEVNWHIDEARYKLNIFFESISF